MGEPDLLDVPYTFGLSNKDRARVTELLELGKTWDEIGEDVGWDPSTLQKYYQHAQPEDAP